MQADSKKVIRLLKTVRGQMDGIIKMVEENRYCVEISNQIMASRAILSRVNNEVLLAHIANCVLSAPEDQQEERMAELSDILNKMI